MALQIQRLRCSKRELTITAAAMVIIIFTLSLSSKTSISSFNSSNTKEADWVSFTPLSNSNGNDPLCLDGSIPGYHFRKGSGSGSDSWLLHVEGGGWCNTVASCSARRGTPLGSSRYMDQVQFSGILSRDPLQNPDFFNWNQVKIRYCDGASFSGHPDSELNNGTKLFFRGQLIWDALMDDLLSIGLSSAKKALLSGCSAGGLATFLHCDNFTSLLPRDANVKCLVDAGFFLNEKDIAGNRTIEQFYHDVIDLQGVVKSLNKDCISRTDAHKCFFPQEFVAYIKTPIFLVNPAYDFWQIQNILAPDSSDFQHSWLGCKLNIFNCSPSQLEVLHGYRDSFLRVLTEFQKNEEWGMFINSCFSHCQTWMTETWHSPSSPRINNRTIAESVGDWYFSRRPAKHIDCPFPCNPTCYNIDFTRGW